MPTTYQTKPDDMLDALAWRFYGQHEGALEALLDANRAQYIELTKPKLSPGLILVIPERDSVIEAQESEFQPLWD